MYGDKYQSRRREDDCKKRETAGDDGMPVQADFYRRLMQQSINAAVRAALSSKNGRAAADQTVPAAGPETLRQADAGTVVSVPAGAQGLSGARSGGIFSYEVKQWLE